MHKIKMKMQLNTEKQVLCSSGKLPLRAKFFQASVKVQQNSPVSQGLMSLVDLWIFFIVK